MAAVSRPQTTSAHNFNDAWNQPASAQAISIATHRRNQTQPVVLPSVVSRPTTVVETSTPENDPFVVRMKISV